MDFSWLGNLFGSLLGLFNPLKAIKHWRIWAELKAWYERFKKWRDWYRDHVLNPMRQMQQLQRQIYDKFMRPVLTLVDHIRRLTSIVGLFNKKLANKLNFFFLRVESYILEPFNKMTSRVNLLGRAFQGILTPLGYLDRATLLNSVWRDAGLIKQILYNPLGKPVPTATAPPMPTIKDATDKGIEYMLNGTGPYADGIDQARINLQKYLSDLGL